MESNSLRGLFGVSSPRPVEQRVAPQPTEPIENETPFEIPSGMMEQLLANTFTGDGTKHPDEHYSMWMKFVDYLSLQVYPMMLLRRRFPFIFEGRRIDMVQAM